MSYDSDMALIDGMVKTVLGRKHLIESVSYKHSDNWQDVATPYDICGEMCDLVVGKADMYIVFFALEFLEVLIFEKGIDPKSIIFIGDFNIECGLASKMYGAKVVTITKNDVIKEGKFCKEPFIKLFTSEIDMKFNKVAVLMNPPYQIQSEAQQGREGGKAQAKPIYHTFIETVIDSIKPEYMVSINPSRWMIGGMGLASFRERMMNDRHIKKIVHFAGEKEVFPTVSIKGGVNYFLWSKEYDGECEFVNGNTTTNRFLNTHDIILQDNNAFGILDKVMGKTSKYINQTCYGNKPFGIPTNYSKWDVNGINCYTVGKKINKINTNAFTDKHYIIGKWKVCTSKATVEGSSFIGNVRSYFTSNSMFIIEPNAICTETYIVVNAFDSKRDAENFMEYMKSKFFRFMLGLRVLTQDINKEKFSWVPDVEDYSAPWTDAELYKKFNLTRQEVAYIESKIKAI